MNKFKAKMTICALLGVESFSAIMTVFTAVYALCAWGQDLSSFSTGQVWMANNAVYILGAVILIYGIILRPIRRKLLSEFTSLPHFNNKLLISLEIVSAAAILTTGIMQMSIPYLVILSVYSIWKAIEYAIDRWIFKAKGGYEM